MYTRHKIQLLLITIILLCIITYIKYSIVISEQLLSILTTLTGFSLTALTILLSTSSTILKNKDIRKKNKTELEVIIIYYNFSVVLNISTILLIIFFANQNYLINIGILTMFVLSMYSFYLCLSILTSIFIRSIR